MLYVLFRSEPATRRHKDALVNASSEDVILDLDNLLFAKIRMLLHCNLDPVEHSSCRWVPACKLLGQILLASLEDDVSALGVLFTNEY